MIWADIFSIEICIGPYSRLKYQYCIGSEKVVLNILTLLFFVVLRNLACRVIPSNKNIAHHETEQLRIETHHLPPTEEECHV